MAITNSVDVRFLRRILFGLAIFGSSVEAQTPRLAPKEVAQIVDAALQAVIPPEKTLTQITVADRGVRFDFARTMAAFGYEADSATAKSILKLRSTPSAGTRALLGDCSQAGTKACKKLGHTIYVYVEPESTTGKEAVVSVHVAYVTTSPKRAFLSGFTTEVHLSRNPFGQWEFDHVVKGLIF